MPVANSAAAAADDNANVGSRLAVLSAADELAAAISSERNHQRARRRQVHVPNDLERRRSFGRDKKQTAMRDTHTVKLCHDDDDDD